MRHYLPLISTGDHYYRLRCPLDDKLIYLRRNCDFELIKNRSCVPHGTISYGLDYCDHFKGSESEHENVKDSVTDYVIVCDAPQRSLFKEDNDAQVRSISK